MANIRDAAARVRAAVPTPPLHDDWRGILRKAWSARLLTIAIVLSGAEAVLPLFSGTWPLPPWATALITFALVGGALWARLSVQKNMGASE